MISIRFSKRSLVDGAAIPCGYRIAYLDFPSRYAVAYPIGLHWIARAVRRAWELSYVYSPSRLEGLMMRCRSDRVSSPYPVWPPESDFEPGREN
jgi:hypothetical protein